MQKDEVFFQSYLYTLSGLVANPQNIKAKASDLVEQALNLAVVSQARLAQVVSAFNAPGLYTSAAAFPADATISYGANISGQVNLTPDALRSSISPTNVKQPDGTTSIAGKGGSA